MIKQLRIIILFILLGTGTCLTAQNNTVTPLFAGKIGYHQYFGNDILLKDVVSPSGGNGTYSISWEYRYTDSNEWSEITRLAQSDYEGGCLVSSQLFNTYRAEGVYIRRKVVSGTLVAYSSDIRVKRLTEPLSFTNRGGEAYIDLTKHCPSLPGDFICTELWLGENTSDWCSFLYTGWENTDHPATVKIEVMRNFGDHRSGQIELLYRGFSRNSNFSVDMSNYQKYKVTVKVEQSWNFTDDVFLLLLPTQEEPINPGETSYGVWVDNDGMRDDLFRWWQYSHDQIHWVDVFDVPDLRTVYQPGPLYQTTYFRMMANDGVDVYTSNIVSIKVREKLNLSSKNYIHTRTYTTPDGMEFRDDVEYFDGLGRSIENVKVKHSVDDTDLLSITEYDKMGRLFREWLPGVSESGNCGAFVEAEELKNSSVLSNGNDVMPYTKTLYENSAIGKVESRYGPGMEWHNRGKGINSRYLTNVSKDTTLLDLCDSLVCLRYTVPTDRTRLFVSCAGTYASGELYVVKEVDEDNHVRYEFTDKEGRIVLTRSINGNEGMDDTYYIYDIFGNLRVVLPPMCSANFYSGSLTDSASVLSDYAFLYKYDTRNRCIGKKQPGCEWVELVYDRCDRLIFTQNGKERANNEWAFHLEDLSGRSVLTGVYLGTPDFQNCASEDIYAEFTSNTDSPYYGYTIYGLQNHYLDIQQVYFYDTYEYQNLLPDSLSSLWYVFDNNYGERYENSQSSPHCKEQLTGSIVRILGTEEYQYASYYYDYYHNLIQERKTTSGGNKKVNKSLFNILKQPVSVRSEYEGGVLNKLYSYDRAGRLIHERHCVVSKDTVDLLYGYDKLGRLKRLERIHGKDSVITENAYNIRSWLTGIDSNAGFVEQLHYVDGLGIPCYNGNISSMTWEVDGMKRGYKFMYDGRSRLLRAVYGEGEGLNVNQDRFNEEITGYDKNGNILGIKRCGKRSEDEYGLIDNLVMSYNGNQLKAVSDSVTDSAHADSFEFKDGADLPVEYYYDSNGNLIQDLNKKISEIQYNCLNLPSRIEFEDGGVISYLYDAKGTKFRTTHVIAGKTTTTDYFDDAIYENGVLTTLLTELGYISLVDGKYHYYLKDHQGNNRVVVGQNGSVEEVNHYYPFGGTFASTSSVQPYKYNGKELDRQGGLDWYDYGARHYDVALGRWHVVDPMAEKYYLWSPYAYCLGNPVRFIDPTGMVTEIPPGFWASFGKGFSQPFVSFWNAVTHPVETVTNVVNSIKSVTPTEAGFGVGEQVLRSPMSPLGSTFNQLDVAQAIAYDKANGTMTSAEVIGNQWGDIAFDAVTTAVGAGVGRGTGLYKGQTLVTNSIPQKVARVIPDGIKTSMLGAPNQSDVFVTAAKDIKGLNAMQIANKLTIPQSSSGFKVIEFRTPMNGLASPINRTNPGFVGKGRTLGGAREFTIPNQQIPKDAIIKIVK